MKTYTVDDIMNLKPCYTRERVTELWAGREAITAREIAALDIPIKDRHWATVRLLSPSQYLLARWVERAIDSVDRATAPRAWCDWADKWKSGDDRTASAASAAEAAARASASAASAASAAWAAGAASAAWAAEAAEAAASAAEAAAGAEAAAEEYRLQLDEMLEAAQ